MKETRQQEILRCAGLMLTVEVSLFTAGRRSCVKEGESWREEVMEKSDGALTDTFPQEAGTQLWSSCSQKEFDATFAVLVSVDIRHDPLRASGDTSNVDGGEPTRF